MIRPFTTLALLLLAVVATAAQEPSASPQKPTGASVIRGRAIYSDTGHPLRRARVDLLRSDDETFIDNSATDRNGEFLFAKVAAGKYLIVVYAPDILNPFEQRGTSSLALRIALGQIEDGYSEVTVDGRSSVKTELRATRGGVITGRVLTETEEPIAKAQIKLFLVEKNGRLSPARATDYISQEDKWMFETDSRGIYRIAGLSSGEYIVRASESNEDGNPDDAAEGSYTDGRMMQAFHPKALRIRDATPVKVQQGSETRDVDIRFTDRIGYRISGTVSVKGQPVSDAEIELLLDEPEPDRSRYPSGQTHTDADGNWELRSIPDGNYRLSVFGYMARVTQMGQHLWPVLAPFRREVVVAGGDLTNLKFELVEGGMMHGLVTVEGGGKLPVGLNVELISTEPASKATTEENQNDSSAERAAAGNSVKDGGEILIAPINAGSFQFRFINLGNAHYVKSITQNGKDLLRNPIKVEQGKVVDGIRIVLATDLVSVSGRVVHKDDRSKPLLDALVFLLPVEPERRRISQEPLATRTDKEGRFAVKAAPGEYFVVVLDRGRKNNPAALPEEATLIKNASTLQKVSLQRTDEKKNVEVVGPSQP